MDTSVEIRNAAPRLMPEVAPAAGWSAPGEQEHFVQFYESDEFLLAALCEYVGAGLEMDETTIVVATEAHRTGLEARLQERGLDLSAYRAAGQYRVLDAAETLERFMVEGTPDPDRFAALIGGILTTAAAGGRPVRV